MTSGATQLDGAVLAAPRSPLQPFTLAGTGTGSCRLPAMVVDVDQWSRGHASAQSWLENRLLHLSAWTVEIISAKQLLRGPRGLQTGVPRIATRSVRALRSSRYRI